jgi:hypothetical protein
MCCSSQETYPQGEFISNADEIKKRAKQLGLIKVDASKSAKKYTYAGITETSQTKLMSRIQDDPALYKRLWDDILFIETGYSHEAV